jgi:hypothetical protein
MEKNVSTTNCWLLGTTFEKMVKGISSRNVSHVRPWYYIEAQEIRENGMTFLSPRERVWRKLFPFVHHCDRWLAQFEVNLPWFSVLNYTKALCFSGDNLFLDHEDLIMTTQFQVQAICF